MYHYHVNKILRLQDFFNFTNLPIKVILNVTRPDRVISKYQKEIFYWNALLDRSVIGRNLKSKLQKLLPWSCVVSSDRLISVIIADNPSKLLKVNWPRKLACAKYFVLN